MPTEERAIDAAPDAGPEPSRRDRPGFLLVGLAVAAVLYVGAAMAWPRTVPRLAVLPAPPGRTWWDECHGQPLNRHVEQWERHGGLWTRVTFSTLAGCIE